jgi:hypothetical protein
LTIELLSLELAKCTLELPELVPEMEPVGNGNKRKISGMESTSNFFYYVLYGTYC